MIEINPSGIYKFTIRFSLLFVGLIMSIYLQSRSFTIGFIVALTIILYIYNKRSVSKKATIFAIIIILIILIINIFFLKTDSSLGRIFIYKISTYIYLDNWVHGIGLGNFKKIYMYYQADYFKFSIYTEKEFLLADNTYFAFNDYYQFIIETGLLGVLTIIFAVISLFFSIKSILKKNKSIMLLNILGVFLAIVSAAFFTYVFNRIEFQTITILCLMIFIFYFIKTRQRILFKILGYITLLILIIFLVQPVGLTLNKLFASKKLKQAKELERSGYRTEAINIFGSLKDVLGNDFEYLEFNSFLLTNTLSLKKAAEATVKLINVRPNNDYYTRLGYIYALSNNAEEAEEAYLMAINMVPNRFINRYKLYNFYKNTGQKKKAISLGKEILNIPVKIQSIFVDQIKLSIKIDLGKL